MVDPSKIDWWDTILGVIGGAFAGVVSMIGWFNHKFVSVDKRLSELENKQGRQEEQHKENLRRFCKTDDGISAMNKKLDRLTEVLIEGRPR